MHVFKAKFYTVFACDISEFAHPVAHEFRVDIHALFQSCLSVKSVRPRAYRFANVEHRAEYAFGIGVRPWHFVEKLRLKLRVERMDGIYVKIALALF